jgi:hypothetical protein
MKSVILISLAFVCVGIFPVQAQNSIGNGGEVIASEFNSIARAAVHFLKLKTLTAVDRLLVEEVEKKIDTTLVTSVEYPLMLGTREVDAINYPADGKILINRKRWELIRLRTPSEITQIVLHEYIWIAGTDDGDYAVSSRLVKQIEKDLNQNSVSTEKYQVALATLYSEVLLFRVDLLGLQGQTSANDFSAFCMGAGSLMANAKNVIQLTNENIFWFSQTTRPNVERAIDYIGLFAGRQVATCIGKTFIDIPTLLSEIVDVSNHIKYLMQVTQFPESSLN